MVAGHLQEKNDFYYIVLSYKDANGKRKTKWEATGLSVKRNKKKAEALLLERRRNFMVPTAPAEIRLDDDILFSDLDVYKRQRYSISQRRTKVTHEIPI